MTIEEKEHSSVNTRAIEKLGRDLGPLIVSALNDPKTIEVLLNADGGIWQEKLGEKMARIGTMLPQRAAAVIQVVAGYHGKTVTRASPLIEGELPLDGSRFAGQLPPVVQAPTFAIRKKAIAIFTLDQYLAAGIMTAEQCSMIKQAVCDHRNILVIGGTGSGKTTLVNAIIHQMVLHDPTERVCIIEDTGEIQCAAQNCVQYHTTLEVTMTMLLKTILRMRPDRILVGEVRGAEALDLLDAWNTGHEGGAATLHANNAMSALTRLKSLITRNANAPSDIEPLIGDAVHVIVHIAKTPQGRRVQGIIEISGYTNGHYKTRQL
ncbi:P-type conjugative transfer ATPase TrbB [Candidatus Fukatsuia symbiotica]|uniref:P-type conjugative transfer ATPase TrbB n=1 Tax=Candidatus Fukatsuia symbiotica TaxID=1878942 RepID=A0A2U8I7C0_9GAMM|nr:P-type conjugative transfer ATPase TrbB [Candidatus Fukatsuia symbiotica]AWK15060.1 P-type conjugative transfer ATPase TrbB [Candidatus Fukatsuia symbiotica]MEA9443862.1 P-type conjugative transfer ATPase TrbB [Candidatus Fukatsuia symbiotica]